MNAEAKVSKQQAAQWKEQRRQNVERHQSACHELAAAIVEHAGDFLSWRAQQIASCSNRKPGDAATAIVTAQAEGLRVSLAEGLGRVDWMAIAPWLRAHHPGTPPAELAPLEQLVEACLSPLRVEFGVPLHPPGEYGPLYHQPLAGECWPPAVYVMETVAYGASEGFPQKMEQLVRKAHPVHRAFQQVADAAQWIDALDQREAAQKRQEVMV